MVAFVERLRCIIWGCDLFAPFSVKKDNRDVMSPFKLNLVVTESTDVMRCLTYRIKGDIDTYNFFIDTNKLLDDFPKQYHTKSIAVIFHCKTLSQSVCTHLGSYFPIRNRFVNAHIFQELCIISASVRHIRSFQPFITSEHAFTINSSLKTTNPM